MLIDLLFVILGIVVLVKSADFLVESSSDLATKLGVSAVVVGAIIVGFGTSMPEMAVSTTAALRGDIDLGIGNVVGSIIANLTLVLGATTFAAKIPLPRYFLKFHIPLSMNAVFWFFVFAQNGFRRYEGFILLGMLAISLWLMLADGRKVRSNNADPSQEFLTQSRGTETRAEIQDGLIILASLVGVIGSSYFITEGAIGLAEEWGVGSGFVGASLVAIGTSLPELVASIVALRKGKSEIIIGTILGSNVFNGVAIGAAIGILGPGEMNDTKIIGWLSALSIVLAAVTWGFKSLSPKPMGKLAGFVLLTIYVFWLVFVGI
tara:strand:- start:4529 stop:5488 length:960 start_codon:yes stop_codon:yes gene_type:complete